MADKTETEAAKEFDVVVEQSNNTRWADMIALPPGWNVHDLEEFRDKPRRIKAHHNFVTVSSLAEYLLRFADDTTMITVDYAKAFIMAQIDGDWASPLDEAVPSWKTHTARFQASLGDQIKQWLAISRKPMKQVTFGQFLENRACDVARPEAADVMEMVMKFEATKKVEFKSVSRLSNGDRQFQYVEETSATRGGITLPDHFIIRVPVYRGQEPQDIKFWVRYSIDDGSLQFTVEMHDQDQVLRDAFALCVRDLQTRILEGDGFGVPFYEIG